MGARLDSDGLIALRRLRRHLNIWRVLAVVAFAFAIFGIFNNDVLLDQDDHVARVSIDGIITEDRELLSLLESIADDSSAKALIVNISSPGGTFTGGDTMFNALRRIGADKPVVAVMGSMATSGGYMVAIAADRIFAGYGTITGSIGVIVQSADVTGLLDKIGVKPEVVKSGDLKATPNPMESLSPDARGQLQGVIDELHARFIQMVAERRGIGVETLRSRVGDGRIVTGAQAVELGLVDAIGDVNAARAWLMSAHDVSADLPLIDWKLDDPFAWWRENARSLAQSIFGNSVFSERLRLDGIQALWHPSMSIRRQIAN